MDVKKKKTSFETFMYKYIKINRLTHMKCGAKKTGCYI